MTTYFGQVTAKYGDDTVLTIESVQAANSAEAAQKLSAKAQEIYPQASGYSCHFTSSEKGVIEA